MFVNNFEKMISDIHLNEIEEILITAPNLIERYLSLKSNDDFSYLQNNTVTKIWNLFKQFKYTDGLDDFSAYHQNSKLLKHLIYISGYDLPFSDIEAFTLFSNSKFVKEPDYKENYRNYFHKFLKESAEQDDYSLFHEYPIFFLNKFIQDNTMLYFVDSININIKECESLNDYLERTSYLLFKLDNESIKQVIEYYLDKEEGFSEILSALESTVFDKDIIIKSNKVDNSRFFSCFIDAFFNRTLSENKKWIQSSFEYDDLDCPELAHSYANELITFNNLLNNYKKTNNSDFSFKKVAPEYLDEIIYNTAYHRQNTTKPCYLFHSNPEYFEQLISFIKDKKLNRFKLDHVERFENFNPYYWDLILKNKEMFEISEKDIKRLHSFKEKCNLEFLSLNHCQDVLNGETYFELKCAFKKYFDNQKSQSSINFLNYLNENKNELFNMREERAMRSIYVPEIITVYRSDSFKEGSMETLLKLF